MTEYDKLKSERYSKTHVGLKYLARNIDFKTIINAEGDK